MLKKKQPHTDLNRKCHNHDVHLGNQLGNQSERHFGQKQGGNGRGPDFQSDDKYLSGFESMIPTRAGSGAIDPTGRISKLSFMA